MEAVQKVDCKNLRVIRQKENNDIMLRLLQSGDITLLNIFVILKNLVVF